MTADKSFKRAARDRARRTGESYTAARYRLLASAKETTEMPQIHMRAITDTVQGFALEIPDDWEVMPPRRNTQEVFSAMARPDGRPFIAISKSLAKNVPLDEWVDRIVASLSTEKHPALDTGRRPERFGDTDAVRLEYAYEGDGEKQTIRAYWLMRPPAAVRVALVSFTPEVDADLLDRIASSFRLV